MKALGIILIGAGIALLVFTFINLFNDASSIASPIPENKGVRVIMVSPSK